MAAAETGRRRPEPPSPPAPGVDPGLGVFNDRRRPVPSQAAGNRGIADHRNRPAVQHRVDVVVQRRGPRKVQRPVRIELSAPGLDVAVRVTIGNGRDPPRRPLLGNWRLLIFYCVLRMSFPSWKWRMYKPGVFSILLLPM